jgi:hypothetical protein
MQIIRAIQKVEDGKVVLKLPAEFAGEDVEIIVLPVRSITESPMFPTKVESGKAIQRFLQIDTSGFTQKQLDAYHHADEQIRKGRKPGEPRILGLTGGLVELAEDFNDPLPDEDLFYSNRCAPYLAPQSPPAAPS